MQLTPNLLFRLRKFNRQDKCNVGGIAEKCDLRTASDLRESHVKLSQYKHDILMLWKHESEESV